MCTLSVSNVIYHKFSHGAAFYTLNGKNVNVMLELGFEMWHATDLCHATYVYIACVVKHVRRRNTPYVYI